MYEGRIIGSADPRTSTREAIGLMMAGIEAEQSEEAAAAVEPVSVDR